MFTALALPSLFLGLQKVCPHFMTLSYQKCFCLHLFQILQMCFTAQLKQQGTQTFTKIMCMVLFFFIFQTGEKSFIIKHKLKKNILTLRFGETETGNDKYVTCLPPRVVPRASSSPRLGEASSAPGSRSLSRGCAGKVRSTALRQVAVSAQSATVVPARSSRRAGSLCSRSPA